VIAALALLGAALADSSARARIWTGTAYFTYYEGYRAAGAAYSYDAATHILSLAMPKTVADRPADANLFAGNGAVLVGGEAAVSYEGRPFEVQAAVGAYRVALAFNGRSVYPWRPGPAAVPMAEIPPLLRLGSPDASAASAPVNAAPAPANAGSVAAVASSPDASVAQLALGPTLSDPAHDPLANVGAVGPALGASSIADRATTLGAIGPGAIRVDLFGGIGQSR